MSVALRVLGRRIFRIFVTSPLLATMTVLSVGYLAVLGIIMISDSTSVDRAIIQTLPAAFGELGTPPGETGIAEMAVMATLIASVAFLTVLTAKITSLFVEIATLGGRRLRRTRLRNHIIVCGWSFQGPRIIEQLQNTDQGRWQEVAILTPSEVHPLKGSVLADTVDWINGDPTETESLLRAGVRHADSVIVLTDHRAGIADADSRAMMITLAVSALNPDTYICVQLVDSTNRPHVERTGADEVVCLDELGTNLVVACTVNEGVSHLFEEMLLFDQGCELYRWQPEGVDLSKLTFLEIVERYGRQAIMPIGYELPADKHGDDCATDCGPRRICINPPPERRLCGGETLFVLATTNPANPRADHVPWWMKLLKRRRSEYTKGQEAVLAELWKRRVGRKAARVERNTDHLVPPNPPDVLICGWSAQAGRIVRMLIEQGGVPPERIAVLADCRTDALTDLESKGVRSFEGDPTDEALLTKAGVFGAKTVVVPSNLDISPNCADSRAIMRVLAVEYLHHKVHSVVEILNSESEVRLEQAHADEVISLDRMGGELLVSCTLTHGLSWIIRELLTFNDGSEVYRCDDIPDAFLGKSYRSLLGPLARHSWLLIGLETQLTAEIEAENERRLTGRDRHNDDKIHICDDMSRAIILNPQRDRILQRGDALFVISKDKPHLEKVSGLEAKVTSGTRA